MSQVMHQDGAYPGILVSGAWKSISTPSWMDACPLQGYPQQQVCWYPFIQMGGVKHCESSLIVLPKITTRCPRPGLQPGLLNWETSTLTMKPPCLPSNVDSALKQAFKSPRYSNSKSCYDTFPIFRDISVAYPGGVPYSHVDVHDCI